MVHRKKPDIYRRRVLNPRAMGRSPKRAEAAPSHEATGYAKLILAFCLEAVVECLIMVCSSGPPIPKHPWPYRPTKSLCPSTQYITPRSREGGLGCADAGSGERAPDEGAGDRSRALGRAECGGPSGLGDRPPRLRLHRRPNNQDPARLSKGAPPGRAASATRAVSHPATSSLPLLSWARKSAQTGV